MVIKKLIQYVLGKEIFRNAGIYTLGHIFNAAIPFMLMPILTRYLSPEDYGITAIFAVLIGIYTPFVGINLHGFVSVSYFRSRNNFKLIVSTMFHILAISLTVTTLITWLTSNVIERLSSFPADWLWSVIFLCFTNFFIVVLQNVQQVQGHAKQYTIIQISHTVMNLLMSIVLVVIFSMNWQGRILAQVISGLFFMVIAYSLLKMWGLLSLNFSFVYARKGLAFGIPLIPHALCGFLILASDRFFISNMVGLSELGIFSVGYSLGQAIELVGTSFNKAFSPWLYEKLKSFDEGMDINRQKIVKFTYLCITCFFVFAVLYSLFMPVFLSIFIGPKFQEASKYILWFALASALHTFYYMVVNYIFYKQKTKYLAMITFGSGVLHIGITYVLIKILGAIGAAYAAVITQVILTILTWWLSNKVYPMPWKIWRCDV